VLGEDVEDKGTPLWSGRKADVVLFEPENETWRVNPNRAELRQEHALPGARCLSGSVRGHDQWAARCRSKWQAGWGTAA